MAVLHWRARAGGLSCFRGAGRRLPLLRKRRSPDSRRELHRLSQPAVSNRNFAPYIEGLQGGHHELSHHQNDKDKIEQYTRINRWHVQQYVRMLDKMRAIKEGAGTLLDNSMILMGAGMSDGNRHDPTNLPILLGGRGGSTIATGQHLAPGKNTPLCNLHLSILDRLGMPLPRFGDSTGKLKALDA
jgi:hypothetical protein